MNVFNKKSVDGTKPRKKSRNHIWEAVKGFFSRWITIFNLPRRLAEDCEVKISGVKLLLHYAVAFPAIALVCLIYELKLEPSLLLMLTYFLFSPRLIYFHYKRKYEQDLFTQSIRYMEAMLYSFSRNSKILDALQESRYVTSGKLLKAVDYAIEKIQNGTEAPGELYAAAFSKIEQLLPNSRVKNMHEFFAEVENKGGRHETALQIMIEDIRGWDVRVNKFIADQNTKRMGIVLSILLCLGTSLFMTNIVPAEAGGHIAGMMAYQVVTTALIVILFLFYRLIAKYLTRSWVTDIQEKDSNTIRKDVQKVEDYLQNGKKGMKPLKAMTRIQTELEKMYPKWCMKFALLLSSLPIPAALSLSIDTAPAVMQVELRKLVDGINRDPNGIEPYTHFFDYLNMPQIKSMMIMIYNLSGYSSKDIDAHVFSLVKRNYSLQENAEKIANDESMARFSLYVTIPMIITCVVILINVALIVTNMLTQVAATIQF